jgi:hypothetical protein
MGIAGFVTGLLGVLLCWIPLLGVILGALGVILGGVGMSQGKRRGSSTALALTGVVLGAIGLVASIVLFVIAYNAVT